MSRAKVTSAYAVNQIRSSIEPDTVLSKRHGVSRKTIYNIRNGIRYNNVPSGKNLRNYPNINVYNDGTVENTKTAKVLVSGAKALSKSIKLTTRDSRRVTVSVAELVKQAFG